MGFKTRKIPRDLLLDPPPRRRRWWLLPAILLAALGLLLVSIDLRADVPSTAESGQLLLKGGNGWRQAIHLESSVDISVTGMVARTTMRQSFRNASDNWQEAVYVFPLPESAAVFDMEMHIGNRIIRSRIEERQKARKIYEKAKADGKKAALTEQQRPNLFTQSIANIPPGEKIDVTLVYIESVRYDNGKFSLMLPLTLTPRYIPGDPVADEKLQLRGPGWALPTDQVADAPEITPFMHPPQTTSGGNTPINPVSITVVLATGLAISEITSPYHEIDIARQKDTHRITLAHGQVSMDRDFVIQWRPAGGNEPQAAAFGETIGANDYALLMVVPPSTPSGYRISRDVIFVIDTSGSMSGTSIVQARRSLLAALESLHGDDRFNIIEFNNDFSLLFNESRPADHFYLSEARDWIADLDAGGGTEMYAPLKTALNISSLDGFLKHIVFITDGAIGNEAALFRLIHEELHDTRLFTVGIGSAPNSFFMRKSAQFGRGTYTHIADPSEVKEKMDALYRKIESPLVDDIKIHWHGSANVEVFPEHIPTLYRGEPLIISAQGAPLFGDVEIEGRSGDQLWSRRLSLSGSSRDSGIGTLWARAKVSALEDERILGREVRGEVIEVALEHRLVTRYTSLVAVEEIISRPPGDDADASPVPNAIARGQVVSKVILPRTATRSRQSLLFGLCLLTAALAMLALSKSARNRSCSTVV